MQLRCPQCETIVTVSDTLAPEERPTHCARCAIRRRLNDRRPLPTLEVHEPGVAHQAAPPKAEGEPRRSHAMQFGHAPGTPVVEAPPSPRNDHVMLFGRPQPTREVQCLNCGTRYFASALEVERQSLMQCTRCGSTFRPGLPGHTPHARCVACYTWNELPADRTTDDPELTCSACGVSFHPSETDPRWLETAERDRTDEERRLVSAPAPPPSTLLFGADASGLHQNGRALSSLAPGAPRAFLECRACFTTYAVEPGLIASRAEVQCTRCGSTFTAGPAFSPPVADAEPVHRVVPPEPVPVPPPREAPFRPRRGFIGVTAWHAGTRLHEQGRRLPLDVWLSLADRLLTALAPIPANDPVWLRWNGPRAFGVDLDGALVVFDEPTRWPPADWVHADLSFAGPPDLLVRARVWSVCRSLVWLLDPFPTLDQGAHRRFERTFTHPHLPKALHDLLDAGLALTGSTDLVSLHTALLAAAGTKPASTERSRAVLFAVGLETPPASELPAQWRDGALEVHLDRLLEQADAIDTFPADPRAVRSNALAMPLTPTRALRLTLRLGERLLRTTPVSAERGLPQRIALPVDVNLPEGAAVTLELQHPEQRAFNVTFEGVVGRDRYVTPRLDPKSQAELDVLLSSLDAHARPPELVARREPPPMPRPPVVHRVVFSTWVLVVGLLLSLIFTLPVLLLVGALALFHVVEWTTALVVYGAVLAAFTVMVTYGLATGPEE